MKARFAKVIDGVVTEIVEASGNLLEEFVEVPQDVACGVGYVLDEAGFKPVAIPHGYSVAGGFSAGIDG